MINNYHIQIGTKNSSFLELYKTLKEEGIVNNKFFLKLYDEELKDLDPCSEDLTPEQMCRINLECSRNIYYFFREVFKICSPGSMKGVQFKINRSNLAQIWTYENQINVAIVSPRQTVKTWTEIGICLWEMLYCKDNVVVHNNRSRQDGLATINKLLDARGMLPSYMKNDIWMANNKTKIGFTNPEVKSISNEVLKSDIITLNNPKMFDDNYDNIRLYFDEVAFNKNYFNISTSLIAKCKGRITSKRLLTVPGNVQDIYVEAIYKHICYESAPFAEFMYDLSIDEVNDLIVKNSTNDMVFIRFNYRELGLSDDWFIGQCRSLIYDWDNICRELLCLWEYPKLEKVNDKTIMEFVNLMYEK